MATWHRLGWLGLPLLLSASLEQASAAPPPAAPPPQAAASPLPAAPAPGPSPNVNPETAIGEATQTIDLAAALRLAGVENPQILIARQRVSEAVALRQLAAAQLLLPTLQPGTSYDQHQGPLQQSDGAIIKLNRSSFYVGAGAYAIAAGSVNLPGVVWNMNLSQQLYGYLISRQVVQQRRFENRAVENEMLRQVATAYLGLLGAEGRLSIATLTQYDAREVVRLTKSYVDTQLGRPADLHRARTFLSEADAALRQAEGDVAMASAALARLLNLEPSLRLQPAESTVVPNGIVPEPIPLTELLAVAILNRPELGAQRTQVREALLGWRSAKVLPFSPNVLIGLSTGAEGGGSNLVAAPVGSGPFAFGTSRFDNFSQRGDYDAVAFWTLQNLGVGNIAMIRASRANFNAADLRLLLVLDTVRTEVANAFARTHARFARIGTTEQATRTSMIGLREDAARIQGAVAKMPGRPARPIELLDSLRLVSESRYDYLQSIVDYNQAQVDLYVSLGQPPADVLARPVPTDFDKEAGTGTEPKAKAK